MNLRDDYCANEAAAFDRNFAFLRGPVDTIYLAYKDDVIGFLPHGDFRQILLADRYLYTKEAIEDLKIFQTIDLK